MCTSVYLADSKAEISSVREFGAIVGIENIIFFEGYDKSHLDACLCGVDVANTLVEAGYKVWRSPRDSMEYIAEKLES